MSVLLALRFFVRVLVRIVQKRKLGYLPNPIPTPESLRPFKNLGVAAAALVTVLLVLISYAVDAVGQCGTSMIYV